MADLFIDFGRNNIGIRNRTIFKRCNCGLLKKNCRKCSSNDICKHNIKIARCYTCKKTRHSRCLLTDFKQGIYENEVCECNSCRSANINMCISCYKNKKVNGDRCTDCFNKFNTFVPKNSFEEDKIRKDNVKLYIKNHLLKTTKNTKQLLYEMNGTKENSKLIETVNKRMQNLLVGIGNKSVFFEKCLNDLLKSVAVSKRRDSFERQLFICSNYSKIIPTIFNECDNQDKMYLMLRIFWYLIHRNSTVIKEYVEGVKMNYFLKNLSTKNLDNDNILTIKEILNHFKLYGYD